MPVLFHLEIHHNTEAKTLKKTLNVNFSVMKRKNKEMQRSLSVSFLCIKYGDKSEHVEHILA